MIKQKEFDPIAIQCKMSSNMDGGDKEMKILITGGSGFIGTNLMCDYINKGLEIINIDTNCPKISEHKKYWRRLDIRNYKALEKEIIEFDPDYIIHLAARTDLDGKSVEDYDSNSVGVENILKVSCKINGLKKIIITSSMLVCKTGYQPKNQKDYAPSTFYGKSKVITEKIVWENQPGCDWAIIRPTSIWGPWFDEPYCNFFDMLIAKRYFHIGNKSCTKTYGYVGNAITQIEQILLSETKDRSNKVFYIGEYKSPNIEEWGNEIAEELGYRILKVPYWIIWSAAKFGDLLKFINIKFPITSFRLNNMTTDNIINLENTKDIAGALKYSRKEGIKETLGWMTKRKNLDC